MKATFETLTETQKSILRFAVKRTSNKIWNYNGITKTINAITQWLNQEFVTEITREQAINLLAETEQELKKKNH